MSILKELNKKLTVKTYLLGVLLVGIVALEAGLTIYIPEFRKYFYNIIEQKQLDNFNTGLFMFCGVIGGLIVTQSIKNFIGGLFSLGLRQGLTSLMFKNWLLNREIALKHGEQRVAEDCRLATDLAVQVFLELSISLIIVIGLILNNLHLQSIILYAVLYTALMIVCSLLFRKPLINKEISVQAAEADLRLSLTKITLKQDDYTFKDSLLTALSNTKHYLIVLLGFKTVSSLQSGLASLVPFIVLVPLYFAGNISFGEVMQGVSIFDLLVINAGIVVLLYPTITKVQASWKRLTEFYIK